MQKKLKNKTYSNFKLILSTLVVLEIVGCYYAYYTLGEVKQFTCILILFLNIIPLSFYFFRKKTISLVTGMAIGLLLIPYQTFLLFQWRELNRESSMILEYIYHHQKNKGEFPKNISGYEFENQKLTGNFSYNKSFRGFGLHYYVGTKGTTHFYYHNVGRWEYYPD